MRVGLQLVFLFQRILFYLTRPIYWVLSRWPRKKLPPIKNEILFQSATSLARQIRSGKLSSVQVVGAYIARIQEVNPHLNAVVQQRFDAALDDARRVDALVASGLLSERQMETETPFLGVPITMKESCRLKGMSLSVGSLPRKGVAADSDGVAVTLVLNSGAIPLAVTNTSELCYSMECDNLITGRTRNPYDTFRTPGGSSGGEGALLGAAASVIGLGSDMGGSIRIPALYNGIFGHKPTPNLVSNVGHFPPVPDPNTNSKYLVMGALARYAEDLAPMLQVLAGPLAHTLRLHEKVDVRSLKVFYMTEAYWSLTTTPVDSEIKSILQKAVDYLQKDCRLETKKLHLKEMEDLLLIGIASVSGIKGIPNPMTYHLEKSSACEKPPNPFIEFLKSLFGMSGYSHLALANYYFATSGLIEETKCEKYATKREELRKIFVDLLEENGVFLYPTHPTPAIYHNQSYFTSTDMIYSMLSTIFRLPSTHVPLGLNKAGLPIGIQVIAAPYQDRLCLAVAKQLEAEFGGWTPPPST